MTPIPPQLEQCIRSLTLSDRELFSNNHISDELEPVFDDAKGGNLEMNILYSCR